MSFSRLWLGLDSQWKDNLPYDYADFDGYSLMLVERHVLRVHVRFGENPRRPWEARFRTRPL